jgi:single-stranded DNA-binding protein
MAIAFMTGELVRNPYTKLEGGTPFAACTLHETYKGRDGQVRTSGYHDVVAFDDLAQQLGALGAGDRVEIKTSVRYRADSRFENREGKNPFVAQFVIQEITNVTRGASNDDTEEYPF